MKRTPEARRKIAWGELERHYKRLERSAKLSGNALTQRLLDRIREMQGFEITEDPDE